MEGLVVLKKAIMKDKDKELKYEIYLIDQEIRQLKKQKKKYVDELRAYETNKTKNKRRWSSEFKRS